MYRKALKYASILSAIILLFTSCEQIDIEEIKHETLETSNVKLTTRAESKIIYPLTFIAFDKETENMVSFTEQESASNNVSLNLPKGEYRFVVISGLYLPDELKELALSNVIEMSEGFSETPLMMGSADINLKSDANVNIAMYNVVTALSFRLWDIPDNIEDVEITISVLYSYISFDGEYDYSTPVTLLCTKNGEEWVTPVVYTFPSPDKRLVLSITMTDSKGNSQTYGYTYNSAIEANTPYNFTGSYIQGFNVNGTISINGWNEPKTIEFTFGRDNENNSDINYTDIIPSSCSIWNGHFVAYSEMNEDETEADVMLLSLNEWDNIASVEYSGSKTESLANSYTENGITGWFVPTSEEVNIMKDFCGGDNFNTMNNLITSNGGIAVTAEGKDANQQSLRYLCDDLQKTYSWKSGSNISNAGLSRTYNLRLIKWIKIKKN